MTRLHHFTGSSLVLVVAAACASKTDGTGAAAGGSPAMGAGGNPAAAVGGSPATGTGGNSAMDVGGTGGIGASLVCVPGATQACLGSGRCAGAQACDSTGTQWGECDCGLGTGGSTGMGGSTTGIDAVGGSSTGPASSGGATSAGGTWAAGGTAAGGSPGSGSGTGGAWGVGGVAGGTSTTGGTFTVSCSGLVIPTATGSLSIASSYMTANTLKGYVFAWKAALSNASTCISPVCDTSGCHPAFGTSALCAAGVVGADTSYNSLVGVGMNINQGISGTPPGSVNMGSSITIGAVIGAGAQYARVMLESGYGSTATDYCVEAGDWAPGTPIPVSSFNTACWEPTIGTPLVNGTAITSVHLVFPSNATDNRPVSACLTNVVFNP